MGYVKRDEKDERVRRDLFGQIISFCHEPRGNGSMSPSLYDTAWVSMVRKGQTWLFPEAFRCILDNQEDGLWVSKATEADCILSSAAALLALTRHASDDSMSTEEKAVIEQRAMEAQNALRTRLAQWNPEKSDQVGFEVLVLQHLSQLEKEGVRLDFPRRDALVCLQSDKKSKSSKLSIDSHPTTMLHSLEACVGLVDFDKLGKFKANGSMLGSPSSTAAYLMSTSVWDDEAEGYLHRVMNRPSKGRRGLVPCAWPTSVFEVVWVTSTLLQAGITEVEIGAEGVAVVGSYLESLLKDQNGLTGFAPGMLPDADDTARAILTLSWLGRVVDPAPMVQAFGKSGHFETYAGERNPSFTANCNVAMALLSRRDASKWSVEILKCIEFLCEEVWARRVKDKWNVSEEYVMMLCSQTVERCLIWLNEREEARHGPKLAPTSPATTTPTSSTITLLLSEKFPIITLHLISLLIGNQSTDGSWKSSAERTSYAILGLAALRNSPSVNDTELIDKAIKAGKSYLALPDVDWTDGDSLWIEKTTFSSPLLSAAYCVAAASCNVPAKPRSQEASNSDTATKPKRPSMIPFFGSLPLFNGMEKGQLQLAYVQSQIYLRKLENNELRLFPTAGRDPYKYKSYIPFTWTAVNVQSKEALSPAVLYEMMSLSVQTFQADEYMEDLTEGRSMNDLAAIIQVIEQVSLGTYKENQKIPSSGLENDSQDHPIKSVPNGNKSAELNETNSAVDLLAVHDTLHSFFRHILTHSSVPRSSAIFKRLHHELTAYFISHVVQARDNLNFAYQNPISKDPTSRQPPQFHAEDRSYYSWARGTSADSTSCPFAFVFFTCLISPNKLDIWRGARTNYLLEEIYRRLATMCRQYNDWGSIVRDHREGNLNSINFPEFINDNVIQSSTSCDAKDSVKDLKKELMWVAQFERAGLELALSTLRKEQLLEKDVLDALQVFVNVTDLYGQIYVQRDLHETSKAMNGKAGKTK